MKEVADGLSVVDRGCCHQGQGILSIQVVGISVNGLSEGTGLERREIRTVASGRHLAGPLPHPPRRTAFKLFQYSLLDDLFGAHSHQSPGLIELARIQRSPVWSGLTSLGLLVEQ